MRAIYQSPIGAIALKSTFNRFKFPFSQNSRFELKREIVAKGNLKAKTGKMPTQRVAKQKREFKQGFSHRFAKKFAKNVKFLLKSLNLPPPPPIYHLTRMSNLTFGFSFII